MQFRFPGQSVLLLFNGRRKRMVINNSIPEV
jgi:hypothetical protein